MSKEELKKMLKNCPEITVKQFLLYAKKIDGLTTQGVQEMKFMLEQSGMKGPDLGLQLLLWL